MFFSKKKKGSVIPIIFAMGATAKPHAPCSIFPLTLKYDFITKYSSRITAEVDIANPQLYVAIYHEGFAIENRLLFDTFLLAEAKEQAVKSYRMGDLKQYGIKPHKSKEAV